MSERERIVKSYGDFSRVASTVTLPLLLMVIVRCQGLNPDFSIMIECSPCVSCRVEGVVPTNLPSMVISAPSGVDLIATDERLSAETSGFGAPDSTARDGLNFKGSRGVSAATYAVISVPFGIVISLPCMKRKNGAAGKKTMLVATIAPVIAPV